jgi:tetratricopeptide (TPR) repeat protein
MESGDAEAGSRLAGALWRFWYVRGYYREGRERLVGLLALPGAARRLAARAKALHAAGVLAHYQGDYDAADPLYEESLAIKRDLGDRRGIAKLLGDLGNVAYEHGDYRQARSLLEESLAIQQKLGDRWGIAAPLNNSKSIIRLQIYVGWTGSYQIWCAVTALALPDCLTAM